MHPQKKIKIAVTGGIGTGKTFISKQFSDKGIPVFYADEETKKLYCSEKVLSFFKKNYGEQFFTDNRLDFSKFSDFVFSNSENRKEIESFIHPLVMQLFQNWVLLQDSDMVALESAIIYEAGLEHHFDKIIAVDAPLEVRIKRIKDRNPLWSQEEIMQRIEAQISQEEKCKRADYVIWNG